MGDWNQNAEDICLGAGLEMSGVVPDENQMDFTNTKAIRDAGGETVRSAPIMGWTDEKHSSYLSSMEASFVEQLRNQEHICLPMHFQTRLRRGKQKRVMDSNPVPSINANNTHFLSYQVHCGGCWKKVSFGRACCQPEIENESRVVLENPWIQRFRSGSAAKGIEADLPINPEEDRGLSGDQMDSGGHSRGSSARGMTTNSRQFLPSLDQIYGSNKDIVSIVTLGQPRIAGSANDCGAYRGGVLLNADADADADADEKICHLCISCLGKSNWVFVDF
ncbi:hypothetical protein ACLOJK_013736 [Asimina triloba]